MTANHAWKFEGRNLMECTSLIKCAVCGERMTIDADVVLTDLPEGGCVPLMRALYDHDTGEFK